jgi:hypothetical protein
MYRCPSLVPLHRHQTPTGTATLCLLLCVSLWARLILGLSQKGAVNKAALSIGMSWLAQCGGGLLALLSTVNLVLAARRIDKELVALNLAGHGARRGSKGNLHGAGSHHSHGHHKEQHQHQHHHHHHKEHESRSTGDSPVPI